jgi:hypothetical protein
VLASEEGTNDKTRDLVIRACRTIDVSGINKGLKHVLLCGLAVHCGLTTLGDDTTKDTGDLTTGLITTTAMVMRGEHQRRNE